MAQRRSAADQVADVVFYGPLGLLLEGRQLMPQLVKRGRRQVAFTRTIGKYAVARGRARVDEAVGDVRGRLPLAGDGADGGEAATVTPLPADAPPNQSAVAAPPPGDAAAHAVDGVIPGYDSLSAVQVVPRLEALAPDELARVRAHEAVTRARRTILTKITQLES